MEPSDSGSLPRADTEEESHISPAQEDIYPNNPSSSNEYGLLCNDNRELLLAAVFQNQNLSDQTNIENKAQDSVRYFQSPDFSYKDFSEEKKGEKYGELTKEERELLVELETKDNVELKSILKIDLANNLPFDNNKILKSSGSPRRTKQLPGYVAQIKRSCNIVDIKIAKQMIDILERIKEITGFKIYFIDHETGNDIRNPLKSKEILLEIKKVLFCTIKLKSNGVALPYKILIEEFSGFKNNTSSKHSVFNALTEIANTALEFFWDRSVDIYIEYKTHSNMRFEKNPGLEVLENFMLWICSYRDLFSRPCHVTKLLIMFNDQWGPLPPVFRPFNVSHKILELNAKEGSPCLKAYHLDIAQRYGWID